ncbi:hypothetical protein HYX10_02985 [Candidatus Woesearchaeota archaeon]|nr:hypothetical protein [Candidatus Woesearchaeota archaeon]
MMKIIRFAAVFLLMAVGLALTAYAQAAQPVLNDISPKTVAEGQKLAFTISSNEADFPDAAAPVNFKMCDETSTTGCVPQASPLTIGSTQATLVNTTKTTANFEWTPGATQAGVYKIRFSAQDGNSIDFKIVTITVNDAVPAIESAGTISLGSASQARSNPNHDDERDREVNDTEKIKIKNAGIEKITGITVTVTPRTGFSASDFKNRVTVAGGLTELEPGQEVDVELEMRIPQSLDAVDENGNPTAFLVADMTITAFRTESGKTTEQVSKTIQVTMQAENQLEIKDARIRFNGDSEGLKDDDNVKDVRPGHEVVMEFEVESQFKDKEDVQIENIELRVESDNDLNVDEDVDVNDLDPEDTDTVEIEFDIDDDVDKGDEGLTITLMGEDEFGARHGESWAVILEIEREDHEIDIRSIALTPETVSCETDAELSVEIRNTGRRDERETFIRVNSPDLQYGRISDEIELDEDDEVTRTFVVPVPEGLAPGNYRIQVETYYNTNSKSMSDGLLLKKAACGTDVAEVPEQPPEPPAPADEVVVITTPPTTPPAAGIQPPPVTDITGGAVTAPPITEQKSFLESNGLILLLALAYIVVLGGGAIVAAKLLRK